MQAVKLGGTSAYVSKYNPPRDMESSDATANDADALQPSCSAPEQLQCPLNAVRPPSRHIFLRSKAIAYISSATWELVHGAFRDLS